MTMHFFESNKKSPISFSGISTLHCGYVRGQEGSIKNNSLLNPGQPSKVVEDLVFPRVQFGYDLSRVPVSSRQVSIPGTGEDEKIEDTPSDNSMTNLTGRETEDTNGGGGGTGSVGPTGGAAAGHCDNPLSMEKVINGKFQGKLSLADYYPDLVGGGHWQHGDSGGPWDSGSRVGSNAQLVGTFPIPCRVDLYSLAQTVTYTKAVFDGAHDPFEGKTRDDIAKSGRDASRAPFRQEWFNKISMADPPNVEYTSVKEADFDREFVTSLVGPGGQQSVTWNTSIRIRGGRVTKNTIS